MMALWQTLKASPGFRFSKASKNPDLLHFWGPVLLGIGVSPSPKVDDLPTRRLEMRAAWVSGLLAWWFGGVRLGTSFALGGFL